MGGGRKRGREARQFSSSSRFRAVKLLKLDASVVEMRGKPRGNLTLKTDESERMGRQGDEEKERKEEMTVWVELAPASFVGLSRTCQRDNRPAFDPARIFSPLQPFDT